MAPRHGGPFLLVYRCQRSRCMMHDGRVSPTLTRLVLENLPTKDIQRYLASPSGMINHSRNNSNANPLLILVILCAACFARLQFYRARVALRHHCFVEDVATMFQAMVRYRNSALISAESHLLSFKLTPNQNMRIDPRSPQEHAPPLQPKVQLLSCQFDRMRCTWHFISAVPTSIMNKYHAMRPRREFLYILNSRNETAPQRNPPHLTTSHQATWAPQKCNITSCEVNSIPVP